MARGGYRKPASPAPVSLPQSGARTDGGAGQPIRLASNQAYGERQAMEAAQAAAPMAAGEGTPTGGSSPAPSGTPTTPAAMMAGLGPMPNVFAPTNRPNEPLGPSGPNPATLGEIPADAILRRLYAAYPNPYIARLLKP